MGIDAFRGFIFPNNVRKYRKLKNVGSLLQLAQQLPTITYIRLSKIERGEIFARAEEISRIGAILGVDADKLLVDIDDPTFDIAAWVFEFQGAGSVDPVIDSMTVLLGAALRARRAADATLTMAVLEQEYGIAPVILSRIENAHKPLDRWADDIKLALCRIFDVKDAQALQDHFVALHAKGDLDAMLPLVANPETRIAKTREKVRAIREALAQPGLGEPRRRGKGAQPLLKKRMVPTDGGAAEMDISDVIHPLDSAIIRLVPVFGAPLGDGLIARTATGEQVEAPRNAGPRAYGLRIWRPTLGSGLPGRAIVVVDPDRFPSAGGLAVVREQEGLRLLSVMFDRQGRMLGYSEHPDREIAIDDLDPENVATVLPAQFE
jgi:hypothetical protein